MDYDILMAVVEIHPMRIEGLWQNGIALDFHTTSSTPIGENAYGHMQFDTIRPPIAELLYRLKYRSNREAADSIIETAAEYLRPHLAKFDLIVPVPPSKQRVIQPVPILANGISASLSLPIANCITATRTTEELKGIDDKNEREKLLAGLYSVDSMQTRGKSILLFDDLFRSGATMNAITELLLGPGQARLVQVLTITKTRSTQ